ncbi:tumor suppressor, Mitostatin-domain-containing protein [Cladochytrium replicatum]|nr:tumor suppressor, Mitostatin-domain-containing protein [Cladochytrium replicatum]
MKVAIQQIANAHLAGSNSNGRQKEKRITVITRDNIRTLRPRGPPEANMTLQGDVAVGIAPGGGATPSDILGRNAGSIATAIAPTAVAFPIQTTVVNKRRTVGGGGSQIGDLSTIIAPAVREGPGATVPAVLADMLKPKRARAYVLPVNDLARGKNASIYLTKEELERRNVELNAQRINAAEEAQKRKTIMEEWDHKRAANSKLSELDQEAKDKSNYLLAKAQMQLEEQEDEVKHLNELMLYAKCVAIRDAQVEEKKLIRQEKRSEEARLDAMMEVERVNEVKKLEEHAGEAFYPERVNLLLPVLRKGAAKIREQIEERREASLLEQERRDQETKGILKAIKNMQEQDVAEKLVKLQSQKKLMLEVAKANQDSTERKRQQKLAEEEEDRKVLQYLLDREAREIENDKLLAAKKAEREKELARLRAAQQKISDKQAQQDALRAQRAFEAYERDWRRKEKEQAERQAAQEKELRAQRLEQQRARENAIAVEAHKMKEEFYENLKRQKEIEEKLQAEEMLRAEKNRKYSMEVKVRFKI